MKALGTAFTLAVGVSLVAGCAELRAVGQAAGVVPSEETQELDIVNARLSLPPDFNLRPPQAGSGVSQARAATSRGEQAVFGDKRLTTARTETVRQADRTDGEAALLKHAGGSQSVDGGIRDIVDEETVGAAEAEKRFTDKLLKWRPPSEDEESADDTRPAEATDRYTPVVTKK